MAHSAALVAVQLSVLWIVFAAGVQSRLILTQFQPRRSFRSLSTLRCDTIEPRGALMVLVAVQAVCVWIVSAAGVKIAVIVVVSPSDDHFAAGPDCGVTGSSWGRVGRAGRCPTVGGRDGNCPQCSKSACRHRHPR